MTPEEALADVRAELREVDPVTGVVEAAHAFVLAAAVERVVAVWTDPAARRVLQDGSVRAAWPDLGEALDALPGGAR